jgi:hypothetical protein
MCGMSSAERVKKHRERSRAAGRDRYEVRGDRADAPLVRAVAIALAEKRVSAPALERLIEPAAQTPIGTWADFIKAMREAVGPEGYEWPERRREPSGYADFE